MGQTVLEVTTGRGHVAEQPAGSRRQPLLPSARAASAGGGRVLVVTGGGCPGPAADAER